VISTAAMTRKQASTPAGVGEPMAAHDPRRGVRLLDQAQRLDGEHREHARHEVQEEPADERQTDGGEHGQRGPRRGRERGGPAGVDREGLADDGAVTPVLVALEALLQDEHPVHRTLDGIGEWPTRHRQRQAPRVHARLLRGGVLDQPPLRRVEPHVRDAIGGETRRGHREDDALG
jgi:hypothetical protein